MNDTTQKRPARSKAEQRERREMFGFHPDITNAGMPMPRPVEEGDAATLGRAPKGAL